MPTNGCGLVEFGKNISRSGRASDGNARSQGVGFAEPRRSVGRLVRFDGAFFRIYDQDEFYAPPDKEFTARRHLLRIIASRRVSLRRCPEEPLDRFVRSSRG
jgi:hypothetical protein